MRIGVDARFLGASSYGLAQYSESLLTALTQVDTTNEYIIYVNPGLKRRIKIGKNFHIRKVEGRPLSVKGMMNFSVAVRREHFDLFHVHFPLVPVAFDCPTLITVHDTVPFSHGAGHPSTAPFWDRVGGRFLYPMTMHRARWILCVSHSTRRRLIEIFPNVFHKTIVVRSGIEEIYKKKTEPAMTDLIRSNMKLLRKYILYSGSYGAGKNVLGMIRAFAELQKREPLARQYEFVLDMTIDRRDLVTVHQAIANYGVQKDVRILTGLEADERHVLFEQAAVLFLTSTTEGFCFPAIRAQLCGVPVVAADAGALPEICGEGSLLVDPENLEEVVTILGRALFNQDLRAYLIEKGLKNAQRFSWPGTAREVKQIYELLF